MWAGLPHRPFSKVSRKTSPLQEKTSCHILSADGVRQPQSVLEFASNRNASVEIVITTSSEFSSLQQSFFMETFTASCHRPLPAVHTAMHWLSKLSSRKSIEAISLISLCYRFQSADNLLIKTV